MAAMSPGALRRQFVEMDEIIDAMDTRGEVEFFLDLESGKVELWIDPSHTGEDNDIDPEDDRFVEIPRVETRDQHRTMEAFVEALDDEDARLNFRRAITGPGAFAGFRGTMDRHPDLRPGWEEHKRDRLLKAALEWLATLGIDPQYELRPIPGVRPLKGPEGSPGKAQIGLFDLMLLGAPEDNSELVDGRVQRIFTAAEPERARKVFERVAREICEHHGLEWRRRFIEGQDHYELDRFRVTHAGRKVELSVTVTPAVWEAFAPKL
jgi:hypothetical protein